MPLHLLFFSLLVWINIRDKGGNAKDNLKSCWQQIMNTLKGSHKLPVGLFVGKGQVNSTRQQHQTTWQQLALKKIHCKTTTTTTGCKSTTLQVAVTFKNVQYLLCCCPTLWQNRKWCLLRHRGEETQREESHLRTQRSLQPKKKNSGIKFGFILSKHFHNCNSAQTASVK